MEDWGLKCTVKLFNNIVHCNGKDSSSARILIWGSGEGAKMTLHACKNTALLRSRPFMFFCTVDKSSEWLTEAVFKVIT